MKQFVPTKHDKAIIRKTKPATTCDPRGTKIVITCSVSGCIKEAPFIINRKPKCFEHSGIRRAVKSKPMRSNHGKSKVHSM